MKKLTLIAILCLLLALLAASPVSRNEAVNVASVWMRHISETNSVAEVTATVNPVNPNTTDWYVVNFSEGGYILISADDILIPVLGYDTNGSFSTTDLPQNLAGYLNQLHLEISAVLATANITAHPAWQSVRQGDFAGFLPDRPVTPMLTTNWDQGWPFNSMCPTDYAGPGGHVYAGCGATAMAQIIRFWAYPVHGNGSHTYTHPTYGSITADFGATTYNYAGMPNSLYNTPNVNISTLTFHCGVALNMDYGADASGSYATDVRPAFVNYFTYEPSAALAYKSGYTAANWEALLRADLDAGHPMYYFGQDTTYGGHAFVCDGYSGTNYFHFNWGWSGSSNGYFYVSNLNPAMYQFNSQQGIVHNIQPVAAIAAPTGLVASVDDADNVFLEWTAPPTRALLGFNIYRNGVQIDSVADPYTTFYYDINPPAGTYNYYVTATFTQGESAPSNTAVATIYPAAVINYLDSFESFANFTTDLTPWFSFDLDGQPTQDVPGIDFVGEGSPMSFISLNPSEFVPPAPEFNAMDGSMVMACFPVVSGANNDWLVTPKWNTGSIAHIRFWAKSANADAGLATMRVAYNVYSPNPGNMVYISGDTPLEVPAAWTQYDYTLTGNTYANLFVGVQCLTGNGGVLLIDDFQLWTSYAGSEDGNATPVAGLQLQAYPNPFSAGTRLAWEQKSTGNATLRIYDLRGRLVNSLTAGNRTAGSQSISWNGTDLNSKPAAAGIYFARLTDGHGSAATQKLVLIK
jgi:hypothetical protein